MFSLVQTVLLRPLPYGDAGPSGHGVGTGSIGNHVAVAAGGRAATAASRRRFAAMSGYQELDANLTGGQEPERVRAASVTPNLFEVLRVPAALGRVATAADVAGGISDVIVFSHGLWQRRFGGATDIVGRSIQVNGAARTVIGVMPASFRLPSDYLAQRPTEAWMPQVVNEANLGAWGNRSFTGVAPAARRRVAGGGRGRVLGRLPTAGSRPASCARKPDGSLGGLARRAIPVQDFVTGGSRTALWILLGSVAFVLLIACANVANLQLARADVRRREVARARRTRRRPRRHRPAAADRKRAAGHRPAPRPASAWPGPRCRS